MNDPSSGELAAQHLQTLADQLSLQFGTMLFLCLAYVLCALVFVCVLLDWRRFALILFFVFGCVTFLVPCPLTFAISPAFVLGAPIGFIWSTIRGGTKRSQLGGANR